MPGPKTHSLILSKLAHPIFLCFTIIPLILSIFLLVGCYNTSQTSTYLIEYYFNEQSPLYKLIQNAYNVYPQTRGLQRIKVKTGYMGICIENIPEQLLLNISSPSSFTSPLLSTTSVCYPRKNVTHTSPLYTDLTIKLSSSDNHTKEYPDLQLNLLQLAQTTAIHITHPYLPSLTIILALTLLLITLYNRIPLLPYKRYTHKCSLMLSLVVVLVCGMSCIWTHIGVKASFELVPRASFGVLGVRMGRKAIVMGWVSFVFYLVVGCWLWFSCEVSVGKEEEEMYESSSFESKV